MRAGLPSVGCTGRNDLGPQLVVPESTQLGKWCGQKSLPPRNEQLRPRSEISKTDPPVTQQRLELRRQGSKSRTASGWRHSSLEEISDFLSPIMRTGWKNGGIPVYRRYVRFAQGSNRLAAHTKDDRARVHTSVASRPDLAHVLSLGFVKAGRR